MTYLKSLYLHLYGNSAESYKSLSHVAGSGIPLTFYTPRSHICDSLDRPLALNLNIVVLGTATSASAGAGLNPDDKV
jgi:hypothetical protein